MPSTKTIRALAGLIGVVMMPVAALGQTSAPQAGGNLPSFVDGRQVPGFEQRAAQEAANKAAEAAERKRLAEEAEALRRKVEETRERAEAERQRLAQEAAQLRKAAEEAKRIAERERAQREVAAAEAKRMAREKAEREAAAEAERKRLAEEAEAKRLAELEAQRKAAEAAERQRLAAKAKAEAERQAALEEQRRAEEEAERRRLAREAREAKRLAELEAQRQAEQEAERKRIAEANEAKRRAELEAQRQAEQEAERKRLADANEAKRRAELEAQRKAEQEAERKRIAEANEAKRRAELEAQRQAEQEAERKRIADANEAKQRAERQVKLERQAQLEARQLESIASACAVDEGYKVQVSPEDAGRLNIGIASQCRGGEKVSISYGGYAFTTKLDGSGDGKFLVDLFLGTEPDLAVNFADGSRYAISLDGLKLAGLSKVAIVWTQPINLNLHALEYLARPGSTGHVWARSPSSIEEARSSIQANGKGRGFMSTAMGADQDGDKVDVYTFLHAPKQRSGVVSLFVDYQSRGSNPSGEYCGQGSLATISFDAMEYSPRRGLSKERRTLRPQGCGKALSDSVRYNPDTMTDLVVRR